MAIVAFLAGTVWPAVWGNLLASVLWVPVGVAGSAVVHHLQLRAHDRRQDRRHAELMRAVQPQMTTATGGAANVPHT